MENNERQPSAIGRYLRERREELGLSRPQIQTATHNGVSASYLEQIETGIQERPSAAILGVLTGPLQVDLLYLLKLARYLGDDVEAPDPQPAVKPAPLTIRGRDYHGLTGRDLTIIEQTAQRLQAAAANVGDKKVFTQEEVDDIVKKRVIEERDRSARRAK